MDITLMDHRKLDRAQKGFEREQRQQEFHNAAAQYRETLQEILRKLHIGQCFSLEQKIGHLFNNLGAFGLNRKGIWHVDPHGLSHPPKRLFVFSKEDCVEQIGNALKIPRTLRGEIANDLTKLVDILDFLLRCIKLSGDIGIYDRFLDRTQNKETIFNKAELFLLVDDNLFSTSGAIRLIHGKNYRELPSELKEEIPTKREFQAAVRLIKHSIKEWHKDNIVAAHKPPIMLLMQDIVTLLKNNNYNLVEKISFEASAKPKSRLQGDTRFSLKRNIEALRKENFTVPEKIINYIVHLTDGDMHAIDQLAKLFARINLGNKYDSKVIGIVGNKNIKLFLNFLMDCYSWEEGTSELYSLKSKSLKRTEYIAELIQKSYLGLLLTIILPEKSRKHLDEEYFRRLKKIIRSQLFKINDPAYGELKYVNRAVWVTVFEHESELGLYQEYLGGLFETVHLSNMSSNENFEMLRESDVSWVFTIFATYGLVLLLEKKKIREKYDKRKVIDEFIKNYCVISAKAECYKAELYESFYAYFIKKFSVEPITRERFQNIILSQYELKEVRPRHNRQDHKRGFQGISVDKEKLENFFNEAEDGELKKEKVAQYLDNINEKVLNLMGISISYVKEVVNPD